MSEVRRDFLVGLFMVTGLGALGLLMVMFGETPRWLGGAEYEVRIHVKEISGVDDGTPVFLNGIKVGRITELTFMDKTAPDRGVVLVSRIKKDFIIPRGATATCIGPALGFGRGRVEILAEGTGMAAVGADEFILGEMGNPLKDIFSDTMMGSLESTVIKIGNFADDLTPVAQDLHEIFKKTTIAQADEPMAAVRGATANLYTVIQRFDSVLKHFNDVFGDPQVKSGLRTGIDNLIAMSADGKAAFSDLRITSANLQQDTARITGKLEGTLDNVNGRVTELSDAALPVLQDAARTSANLKVISSNLAEGKGTMGLLLRDERLYEAMVLSLERATDAVDSLRRLLYRFEKQGSIGISAATPLGPVKMDQKVAP